MRASETRSGRSAGASPEARRTSGMSAVNDWAAITVARSMPLRAMKEPAQRPTNVVSSRRPAARRP
jgi:hypothetical protein